MFLFVILLISGLLNASNHEPISSLTPPSVNMMPHLDIMQTRSSEDIIEEELCEVTLSAFMKRTDSDLAKYIKPQLKSFIKQVTSSPDSDDDNPSPKKTIRKLFANPGHAKIAPKHELDEVVLAAVQKAFEEREEEIQKKTSKIERMFSKKTTALISGVLSVIMTLAGTLGTTYGVEKDCNCTK